MRDEGIDVLLEADIIDVTGRSGSGVKIRLRAGIAERTLEASDVLVATGRTPNTDRVDVDKGGVRLTRYIQVNERLQTAAELATRRSPKFTHVGCDDFRVVWTI